ncbi:MAG: RidA family protein [Myxococcales bacterium]|nr:RidA family protein [Myxococcales bacterium]MCB9576380.1 RidA family protein [Polyangiaceae bacterium]
MPKRIIKTDKAPAAIGPYSQAVISGDLVFTSGQIPLDPSSGELCEGDIEAQTHQVMKNLSVVLDAAGVDFGAVVKTTIYLQDMDDFARVNAAYATYFPAEPPARATVQVARLPKGARVEIDAIARRG